MTEDILENYVWNDSSEISISNLCNDREKCVNFLKMVVDKPTIINRKKTILLSAFIEKNYKSFEHVKKAKKNMPVLYALSEFVKQNIKLKEFLQDQMADC